MMMAFSFIIRYVHNIPLTCKAAFQYNTSQYILNNVHIFSWLPFTIFCILEETLDVFDTTG